ncbi:MAG: chemotaxis protein CheW [Pseudanabaenaceae cyanobacterium SKYGB_i_bin29]|nr:chemotaxis protein CheW [Pseudanabaenaceae cyanobacterium SKYG29]MDW8422038.1 chemotaxis protein CheW [Pseudanabaenaceae cyanobacterium SKYGB_i_bin29]
MFSYLQIGLHAQTYGLPLEIVEEILLLPEITPLPDAPGDVIGIVDRRGQTLPVIHLAKRLGVGEPSCKVTDNLVVVSVEGVAVGVIVERVAEILEITPDRTEELSEAFSPPLSNFLMGVGRVGDTVLPLVNPATLIRSPLAVSEVATVDVSHDLGDFYNRFAPTATPQEQAVFYQRRINLSQQKIEESREQFPLAIAEIDNELMGFPIEEVREFIVLEQPVPTPFSPPFVMGTVNVRSEILTIINIRNFLGLKTTERNKNKAIVVHSDKVNVGVATDEIRGIVDIDVDKTVVNIAKEARQGIMGTAILGGELITIVNLQEVLSKL